MRNSLLVVAVAWCAGLACSKRDTPPPQRLERRACSPSTSAITVAHLERNADIFEEHCIDKPIECESEGSPCEVEACVATLHHQCEDGWVYVSCSFVADHGTTFVSCNRQKS